MQTKLETSAKALYNDVSNVECGELEWPKHLSRQFNSLCFCWAHSVLWRIRWVRD
jgi:hypothetical protein